MVTFQELKKNCKKTKFMTENNDIKNFDGDEIIFLAETSYPVLPKKIIKLMSYFLKFKRVYGNDTERKFYTKNTDMIDRVITKRPLVFMGRGDFYRLRDGTEDCNDYFTVGTKKEKKKMSIKDYMTYDEIEIASFLNISVNTIFINSGNRFNNAEIGKCERRGIYIGQVGARFEKREKMEWKFIIIDPGQNTVENGYGEKNLSVKGKYLNIWAKFYGIDYFPLYSETKKSKRFKRIPGYNTFYFDTKIYKKRIEISARVFLKEANLRAKNENKKAFCHVVGLGLGVWGIHPIQHQITIDVYHELINTNSYLFISDLYFAWFKNETEPKNKSDIKVFYGKRDPAECLNDKSKLLVCNFAWDGNSYPGNEYWLGHLSGSGDPSAICCSLVGQLGNWDVNPYISSKNIKKR